MPKESSSQQDEKKPLHLSFFLQLLNPYADATTVQDIDLADVRSYCHYESELL